MDAERTGKTPLNLVPQTHSYNEPHSRESPRTDQEISFELLPSLTRFLALKDRATRDHTDRVAALTREWGAFMQSRTQWLDRNLTTLEISAQLHDLGKVGVLDEILHKTSMLTSEERVLMEQHAEIGYQMIRDYPGATEVAEGVRYHHERWDGEGYPLGLRGHRIPWIARVISIVDAFDAMTSHRPYRSPVSEIEALEELARNAGSQFDPVLVQEFTQFFYSRRT